LAIAYLLAACGLRRGTNKPVDGQTVLDSATFGMSVLVLMGVVDEAVFKSLGDTSPFLIIAGLVGIVYALRALH
jgi:hypothetical protein